MSDWNANLYNRFGRERMLPVYDLINRLNNESEIKRIIDIGCGSGLSTIPLRNKWASSEIVGVDYSESMLQKTKELNMDIQWIRRDCNNPLDDLGKFDLVFSNAALQWLFDQQAVIENLSRIVSNNGILAMQIPNFSEMQISECIHNAAITYDKDRFEGIEKDLYSSYSPQYYYDALSRHFREINLWQTNYYHIMNDHQDILNFIKSTGLRPYLERLCDSEQEKYLADVLETIKLHYGKQKDGKVLFEFKRIFFVARL